MEGTLSQDEVDALLKGMKDGDVPLEERDRSHEPTPYNLIGEERSVSRQFPGLEIVHDRLVRQLRQSFSGLVGTSVGVEIKSAELLRYARYRNRLEPGSPLSLFSIVPLHGNGLLALGPSLMFQLVDRIFGGQGQAPTTVAPREYSSVELQVVARIATLVLGDLQGAWSMVSKLECRFLRTEMNAAVVAIAASEDMVFTLEIQCDLGCGPTRLTLALPVGILEPVRNTVAEKRTLPAAADRAWAEAITDVIRDTDVEVSVELGRRDMSAGELLHLEVGHLLDIPTRREEPVAVCVEGEQVFLGIAGTNRGQNAVRIVSRPEEI